MQKNICRKYSLLILVLISVDIVVYKRVLQLHEVARFICMYMMIGSNEDYILKCPLYKD